jgi:hypothetical protein
MKPFIRVAAGCLLFLLADISAAQKTQSKPVDTALLRTRLTEVFGDHLAIVKDEMTRRSNWHGGELFWLVHVQPKRVGHYALRYQYNYNGSHYSHVERELRVRVGKQGCLRNPQDHGRYAKFCLGDTVVLPIAINNFTEHKFSLKFTEEAIDDKELTPFQPVSGMTQPINPLEEHLAFVKSDSHKMLHRAGGYTLERYATFEARKPGRFNISLSSVDLPSASSKPDKGGIAIIVLERTAPITAIAGHESIDGFTRGFNGQEYNSSSGGGTSYLTDVVIIQTGDRFSFKYSSVSRSAHAERAERSSDQFEEKSDFTPIIYKLPFSFDKDWGYNEWIMDYAPLKP